MTALSTARRVLTGNTTSRERLLLSDIQISHTSQVIAKIIVTRLQLLNARDRRGKRPTKFETKSRDNTNPKPKKKNEIRS